MPARYCAFNVNSEGFTLCDSSETLPMMNVHGGILAVVDVFCSRGGNPDTSFANQMVVSPNDQEKINCFFDNETMFIL